MVKPFSQSFLETVEADRKYKEACREARLKGQPIERNVPKLDVPKYDPYSRILAMLVTETEPLTVEQIKEKCGIDLNIEKNTFSKLKWSPSVRYEGKRFSLFRTKQSQEMFERMKAMRTHVLLRGTPVWQAVHLIRQKRGPVTIEHLKEACGIDLNSNKAVFDQLRNDPCLIYDGKCFSYNFYKESNHTSGDGSTSSSNSITSPVLDMEKELKTYFLENSPVTVGQVFADFSPKLKSSEEEEEFCKLIKKAKVVKKNTETSLCDWVLKFK